MAICYVSLCSQSVKDATGDKYSGITFYFATSITFLGPRIIKKNKYEFFAKLIQ